MKWFTALLVLNLADYIGTLMALGRGAVEANPLMALVVGIPVLFFVVKLVLVAFGGVILFIFDAVNWIAFLVGIYAAIVAYQVWALVSL